MQTCSLASARAMLLPELGPLALRADEQVTRDDEDEQNPHQPVYLMLLLAAQVRQAGQHDVGDDAERDAVGDVVSERHHGDRKERRNADRQVLEVDLVDGLHHQHADDDQCRARRRSRDEQGDRSEEQGDEEQHARRRGGQTRASAFRDACGALDESRHRARAEHGAAADRDGVDEHRLADALVAFFLVLEESGAVSRADQRAERVEQFNERERGDGRKQTGGQQIREAEVPEVELGEVRDPILALKRVEVDDVDSRDRADERRDQDADQNRAANAKHHQGADNNQADDGQPNHRLLKAAHVNDRFAAAEIRIAALSEVAAERVERDRHYAARLEADDRDEQADADGDRMLQPVRNRDDEHLANLGDRQDQEDDPGQEDGGERHRRADRMTGCLGSDDRRREVCVKPHPRSQRDREVDEQAHRQGEDARAKRRRQENAVGVQSGRTENDRVDGKDVSHCHEGRDARHDLRADIRTELFDLKESLHVCTPSDSYSDRAPYPPKKQEKNPEDVSPRFRISAQRYTGTYKTPCPDPSSAFRSRIICGDPVETPEPIPGIIRKTSIPFHNIHHFRYKALIRQSVKRTFLLFSDKFIRIVTVYILNDM